MKYTIRYILSLLAFILAITICFNGSLYLGMFAMAMATAYAIISLNDNNRGNDGDDNEFYKLT